MDSYSRLPDDVICHILSFLPTKHAVATSILSSRWVNLWSFLTVIDLDDTLYLNPSRRGSSSLLFVNFLDRVLYMNQSQTIVRFRLCLHDLYGHTLSRINELIQNVVVRNVVEIDLGIFFSFPNNDECLKIPNSKSLEVLKVRTEDGLKLETFPGCFPRLTVFDVKVSLVASGDYLISNLFPCLPALEKLCLVGDLSESTGEIYVNVGGVALKRLELELSIDNYDDCDAMVVKDSDLGFI